MSTTRLALILASTLIACGGSGDDDATTPDAGPTADASGAGPDADPGILGGVFRLTTSPDPSVTGLLVIEPAAGGQSGQVSRGDYRPQAPVANEQSAGFFGDYTFDGVEIHYRGQIASATWAPGPGTLTISDNGQTEVWTRVGWTASDSITITGQLVYDVGAFEGMINPRVAYVALTRGTSSVLFNQDALASEPSLDQALALGQSTFTMTRSSAPLASELTAYGSSSIAVGALVVYQDRDNDHHLGTLSDVCNQPGTDCVHALAPMFVVYRSGSSPGLAASRYALVQPGWSMGGLASVEATPLNGIGLSSLDPLGTPKPLLEMPFQSDAVFRIEF